MAGASSLHSWKYHLKVSKFQRFQCSSYFAFSYSMVCITEYAVLLIGVLFRYYLFSFVIFSTRKDTTFSICPSPWSKFKVQSSRFKVQGSKFKIQGSKFKVQGSKFSDSCFSAAASFCSVLETSNGRSRSGLSSLMPRRGCKLEAPSS